MFQSQKIMQACYDSDWLDYDKSMKKTLLLIMERAKRPVALTAGKFATLSLTSFVAVIRFSYSYFALMQRLYSNSI